MPSVIEPVALKEGPNLPTRERRASSKSTTTIGEDSLQDELSTVLSLLREKKRHLDIRQTPMVYINQNSNSDEVQNWLQAKGFSPSNCKKFRNFAGHQLLALNEDHLQTICGEKEGKRLYSQVLIQKSVCNVSTHST